MDIRSLDPYVNDPPGRTNNMYKEPIFATEHSFMDDYKQKFPESNPLCKDAISTGPGQMNACFGPNVIVKEPTPDRLVQFDISVEKARDQYEDQGDESHVNIGGHKIQTVWIALGIFMALIFINLTKR